MALVKSGLKSSLKAIQDSKPPSVAVAANKWAMAIFSYSSAAMAGATVPTLVPASLQASFLASMNAGKFMDNLGADLLKWWAAAPWAGPGFTGVTVPPGPMNSAAIGKNIKDGKQKDVAKYLSDEIDKWTKTVKVTLTNVSSGATSVSPVS